MLRDHVAADLELLADHLASSLVGPVVDPFAPEMVVVPSVGVRSWLSQRLSRVLGAAEGSDGVVANISLPLPGRLRHLVLAGDDHTLDPWDEGSMTWVVHELLLHPPDGLDLGPAGVTPPGGTRYGRAARLARLFDHYHVHRPEMIRRWARAQGRDPSLGTRRWQASLWWEVRRRIGFPSPPELLTSTLDRLRSGEAHPWLPPRLSLFGFTSLTPDLVGLVAAMAQGREVHLYRLRHAPVGIPGAEGVHPLVASWGRQSAVFAHLLDAAAPDREVDELESDPPGGHTALARLQRAIRTSDHTPAAWGTPGAGSDGSVQVHGCPGDTRQVEVLREVLLHLLARNPDLGEADIVVLCPALERFAPIIEGVFGGPASEDGPPRLRFLLSERRPGWSDPMVAAASGLLGLLGGRYRLSQVLDFLSLEAVSRRFDLDPEEMDTVAQWMSDTGVAWGLDVDNRAPWGLSGLAQNTFTAGIDRLLVGSVTSASPLDLGPGGVVPRSVRGDRTPLVGRAWAFVSCLGRIERMFAGNRTLAEWAELLETATSMVAAPDPETVEGDSRLGPILTAMVQEAGSAMRAGSTSMDLAEFRAGVEDRLRPRVGGAYFGTGAVTFASPASLAMVPREVVCLLGLDDDSLSAAGTDGDDLLVLEPREGDRDPRAENRNLLLDALMSARRHLVITYGDRDLARNRPRPPAVPVAELIDVLSAAGDRPLRHHPRHRFDPANFDPTDPWGFDPGALEAARASLHSVAQARERRDVRREDRRLATGADRAETPVVDLGELNQMLQNPTATYLRRAVGMSLRPPEESAPDLIPITDGPLTGWQRDDELLDLIDRAGCHSAPGDLIERWCEVQSLGGGLPPGVLGEAILAGSAERVSALVGAVAGVLPGGVGERDFVELDVLLDPGSGGSRTLLVGRCGFRPGFGPVRISASKEPVNHILEAWLHLLSLTVARPGPDWEALAVCRKDSGSKKIPTLVWHRAVAGGDAGERLVTARAALTALADLHRRGLAEPLPLFGRTSRHLAAGDRARARGRWTRHGGTGDGERAEVVEVWGRLAFDDLVDLPVLPDDPPGVGTSRVERYARFLWGLVERSTEDRS